MTHRSILATLVAVFALPTAAHAQEFVALGNPAQIAASGGDIVAGHAGANVYLVRGKKGFAEKARKRGLTVAPNAHVDFLGDEETVFHPLDVETAAVNPPLTNDDDFFFNLQWGHAAVEATSAWEAGARGAGARVAVLDTGCDPTHPDLAPNVNTALSTSFVPGEAWWDDGAGHGTHVSGTIAAADNAFGTIGVAPEAELVCVKGLDNTGSGDFFWIWTGMLYAADVDADVLNMSLGAILNRSGFTLPDGTEITARDLSSLYTIGNRVNQYVFNQGTTIIVAAGNDSLDYDHTADVISFPAGMPFTVTVSATGPQGWAFDPLGVDLDTFAFYSNYGSSLIDVAAPGGNVDWFLYDNPQLFCGIGPCWAFDLVFSTFPGGWGWSAGTSMATPHVAGVAALIIAANGGDMHPAQVQAALEGSSDDLGSPGADPYYGAGRVNAANAVQ